MWHLAFLVAGLLNTPAAPTLSVLFERNLGQVDRRVAFMARGRSTSMSIAADGSFAITLGGTSPSRISIVPLGAAAPRIDASDRQSAVRNVLVGRDPSKWQRRLPLYGRVRASHLYPGIDAEYYGSGDELEYDFVIARGARPSAIRLRVDGGSVHQDDDGAIRISTAAGHLRQPRPVAYQIVNGSRRSVDVGYNVSGSTIAFDVGRYDTSLPLVIDPLLVASTYTGSATYTTAASVAAFTSTGLYATGTVLDSQGKRDIYIAKYAVDGRTLLFETVYGGSGDETAGGGGLQVDEQGVIYHVGSTTSADLPSVGYQVQPALWGNNDGFLAKLSADGTSILLSTYIGCSSTDVMGVLALGRDIFVTMWFQTPTLFMPNPSGVAGGFVVRLDRDGHPLRLLYTGIQAGALATGPDGTLYLGMSTSITGLGSIGAFQNTLGVSTCVGFGSRGVPAGIPCNDGYIARYSADMSTKLWGTYLRESSPQAKNANETVSKIAVEADGSVVIFGTTLSASFPVTPGAFDTTCNPCDPQNLPVPFVTPAGVPFVARLNASGSGLVFSTFLNGNNSYAPSGTPLSDASAGNMALDSQGNIFLTGRTWNPSFPSAGAPLPQQSAGLNSSSGDAYVTAFTPTGGILYSSRLGGSDDDGGFAVTASPFGTLAVGGYAGASFPLQNPVKSSGTGFLSVVSIPRIQTVVDVPAQNGVTRAESVTIRGWAVDTNATSGTGIDSIALMATPVGGGSTIALGVPTTINDPRPDVALALGGSNFTNSGFATVTSLPPGQYTITAVAHSSISNTTGAPATALVTARAGTLSKIESPSASTLPTPFLTLSGYAVDLDASTGTGVDTVHVWAYPMGGAPMFLGVANYGESRSALSDMFGAQFINGGFSLTATNLAPGVYTIAAHAHSTVTGTFSAVDTVTVTVPPRTTELHIDFPSGPSLYQGFTIGGWAIDRSAPGGGTGVNAIHVWAFPSSGGAAVFLGATTTFVPRDDIAALFGGRFRMSGFDVKTPATLAPGTYVVATYAHSSVTQAFDAVDTRQLTVMAATAPVAEITNVPDGARVTGLLAIKGYAFDPRAASGLGVDAVHMYLYPDWGSGKPAQFLGLATYPIASPAAGSRFGVQFSGAGFQAGYLFPAGAGTHMIVLYAHSTVDNTFAVVSRLVTVPAAQIMLNVDQPKPGQVVSNGFVFGWALDRADVDVTADGTPDGTGIEAVVVYAYPVSGGAPIFVCGPATPYDRGDVAAIYGARFLKSGFAGGCNLSNLTSGTYDLAVFAFSNRTRQYSPPVVVRFTKQ